MYDKINTEEEFRSVQEFYGAIDRSMHIVGPCHPLKKYKKLLGRKLIDSNYLREDESENLQQVQS
jgi:hypothetical protein